MKKGHVHGRFQPFHNGHANYVKWALQHCDQIIIGITNADPEHIDSEETDPDRHKRKNNPYKYYERQEMIRSFAIEEGFYDRVLISPFPINRPDLWDYYAPKDITYFIMVLEDWHREKAQRLQHYDRSVCTKVVERKISATSIRKRMRNNESWETDVPNAVAETIKSLNHGVYTGE